MIRITNLTHIYNVGGNEIKAIDDLSLEIAAGEHIAVLGHNGCGKSTLAKHLNALLLATSGMVEIDDVDTANEDNLWTIRQMVGMVFQNPDNQLVATTVEEDVAFGPENLGLPSDVIRQRVDEALSIVGMSDYKEKGPHLLSGGQKQRVAIASAIVSNREIIVFDEPTSGLDLKHMREVARSLKSLADQGKTLLVITHDPELVMAGCSYVVHMEKGQIKESYPLDESGSKKVLDFFRIRQ